MKMIQRDCETISGRCYAHNGLDRGEHMNLGRAVVNSTYPQNLPMRLQAPLARGATCFARAPLRIRRRNTSHAYDLSCVYEGCLVYSNPTAVSAGTPI